jgi:uncharacterized repeat protein (TIGR01451 family)
MPVDAAARITYFSGLVSGRITTLDADGFTVGSDDDVNRAGTLYYWTAYMTDAGTMEVGTYTGSGVNTTIPVPFQPDYVIVMGDVAEAPTERFKDQPFDASDDFWGSTLTGAIVDFVPTGFIVGTHLSVNDAGSTYHYAAWKSTAGQMAVGTYPGDGNAKDITGPGFQPKFVSIGGGGNTTNAVFRTDSLTGDLTFRYRTGGPAGNKIQTFLPIGFQIGSDRDVNWPGETYYWAAFNPAPRDTADIALTKTVDNPTPEVGDTISYTITAVNNGPSVATNISVLDTLPAGLTYASDLPGNGFYTPASGIWAIDSIAPADSTTLVLTATVDIGTGGSIIDNTAELLGLDQNDTDAGNDTQTAQISVQMSGFRITSGTYDGDGLAGHAVVVGFRPDVVIVKGESLDAAVMRTSTMGPDQSKHLSGPVALVSNRITSFTANGFTVGTSADVNGATTRYHWVAFRADSTNMTVGSYTGDGGNPREIPVGFQPGYVVVLAETGEFTMQRFEARADDRSVRFDADGERPDRIERFTPNGFEVGGHNTVNNLGDGYHFVAWRVSPGIVATGSYPGDTNDNRDIAGIGVDPGYVIVRAQGASVGGVHRTRSLVGDATLPFTGDVMFGDGIQLLQNNGFQVGTDPRTNGPGENFFWVAFQRDSVSAPVLIDSAGTLFPASAFENDPALGLHVALNNASTTGVTLDAGSTVSFSDGSQVYTAALANPTYIPPLANNFTVTFSSAPVPPGIIAPSSYDLTLDLQGLDDQGNAYGTSIVTTGRNSLLIDTPKIMVDAEPLDVVAVRPGARDVPLIVMNFENGYFDTRGLDTLTVTNASIGPGTQLQLDAELERVYLYDDVDDNGSLTPPDTLVTTGTVAAGKSTFALGGVWQLPGLSSGKLIVAADVDSTQSRDSDALDVVVESPGDIVFQPGTLVENSFDAIDPLDSFGRRQPLADGGPSTKRLRSGHVERAIAAQLRRGFRSGRCQCVSFVRRRRRRHFQSRSGRESRHPGLLWRADRYYRFECADKWRGHIPRGRRRCGCADEWQPHTTGHSVRRYRHALLK